MAKPDASVWSSKVARGSSGSMSLRAGASLAAVLTAWNDSYYSLPQVQAVSLRSKLVKGATILA